MELSELIDSVANKAELYVHDMTYVPATAIGLDDRCGYLYVNDECIAVPKYGDRYLQYYGGGEYVEKECRIELGNYVFYLPEDERVAGWIEWYNGEAE